MLLSKIKKKDYANLTHALLTVIAVAGVIGIALVAPGITDLMRVYLRHKSEQKKILRERFYQLTRSGYIRKDARGYSLTRKGRQRLSFYHIKTLHITKTSQWDGKWRLLFFDIPESRRKHRDLFRLQLKKLGFHPLQRSVFLHAYPCEIEVLLLAKHYRFERSILFVEVKNIPKVYESQVQKKYF